MSTNLSIEDTGSTLAALPGGAAAGLSFQRPSEVVVRRSWLYRKRYTLISVASVVVVLAAWQVCSTLNIVQEDIASSPWGVVQAARFLIDSGQLGSAVASSAVLFAIPLAISISVGGIGGVLMGWWRVIGAIFEPWVAMLYAMPLIALLPLILVWFGFTFQAQAIVVILISIFPILVSVMTGTRHVDPELIRLAQSFRGSQRSIMKTVVLPSLVPYFISGIRLATGGALVGVVVSEYFMGNNGIGGLIVKAGTILQPGQVFVGVTILALVSIFLTISLRAIDRRLSRWR